MKDTGPRRILHWWKNVKQEQMEGEVMADWMERKQFGAYISSLREEGMTRQIDIVG